MVLAGASQSIYNITFSYGNYLKLHYPVLGIMKGLIIVILILLFFPDRILSDPGSRHQMPTPMSAHELVLALILTGTLLLWLTDFLHGVSPAWVALAAAIMCLLPFIGLLPVKYFSQGMNFGLLLYVAGVLGVGEVIAKTGLGKIVGSELLNIIGFEPGHGILNFGLMVILFSVVSMVTTAPGLAAVMTPLSADIAKATGFPLVTVLMTQVIGFSNLVLPYQVIPVVVGMQIGGVSATQGARFTLALAAASILILMPANYLWWCLLGMFGQATTGSP